MTAMPRSETIFMACLRVIDYCSPKFYSDKCVLAGANEKGSGEDTMRIIFLEVAT